MNLMNKMNTNNMDERSHRLIGIDKDDFNICETLNPSYIHSHYDESDVEVGNQTKIKMNYQPTSLRRVFESKMEELKPVLKCKEDEDKLLYSLERLCKNFLMIILKERPREIKLSTMNLHNFDKVIQGMLEFDQTCEISIEQLYLNRK